MMIISSALLLLGPLERSLSINEEDLEGSFRNWNTTNKGPEELFKPEVLCFHSFCGVSVGPKNSP